VSSDFDRSTNSLAGMAEGEDLPASEFSAQFAAASAADGDAEREAEPGDNGPAAGVSAAAGGGGGAGPGVDGERGSSNSGGVAGGRREPVIRRVKAAQRESPESPRSSGSRSSAASAAEDKEPEQAGSPGKPSDSGQAPRRSVVVPPVTGTFSCCLCAEVEDDGQSEGRWRLDSWQRRSPAAAGVSRRVVLQSAS
jgi:hypothetical protein